jgi:hypothetical protein
MGLTVFLRKLTVFSICNIFFSMFTVAYFAKYFFINQMVGIKSSQPLLITIVPNQEIWF